MAKNQSIKLKKPLIVIGDPDNGSGSHLFGKTYDYGDICIDLTGCPGNKKSLNIKDDITRALKKMPNNYGVIFVSCILEYVNNIQECINELKRVGGNNLYIVSVSKYSLTCYFYGTLIPALSDVSKSKNVILQAPPKGDFKYYSFR